MRLLSAQSHWIECPSRTVTVAEAFALIEIQTPFHMAYLQEDIPLDNRVYLSYSSLLLEDLLKQVAHQMSLSYLISGDQIVFSLRAARSYLLSGQLIDRSTQAPVEGALIYFSGLSKSTISSPQGRYRIILPPGRHLVYVQHLSYRSVVDTVYVRSSLERNYFLDIQDHYLPALEMYQSSDSMHVVSPSMQLGHLRLSLSKKITAMPYYLGEPDLLRRLSLMPGIQSKGLGAMSVRAGAADQNRILLDGIHIPQPTQMTGQVSVFNPDVIQRVDLYKGSYPPSYGLGAGSSVLLFRQRSGNKQRFAGGLSLGVATLRGFFEGPIIRDKMSFLCAARTSSLLGRSRLLPVPMTQSARFSDANTQLSYQINAAHALSFSSYWGRSLSRANDYLSSQWSNLGASISWQAQLNTRSMLNLDLSLSTYDYLRSDVSSLFVYRARSFVNFYQSKVHLTHFFNPSTHIETGLSVNHLEVSADEEERVNRAETGFENHLFMHLEHDLQSIGLSLGAMLRLNSFLTLGPYDQHLYEDATRLDEDHFLGSISYRDDEIVDVFYRLEPHLFLSYHLSARAQLKFNYSDTYQHFRQIHNTQQPSPRPLFRVTDPYFRPLHTQQLALGLYYVAPQLQLSTSAEAYLKYIDHVYEYVGNLNPTQTNYIERHLRDDQITAQGLELSLEVRRSRLELETYYTLSYATQQSSPTSNTEDAQIFYTDYDQRHSFSCTAVYHFSKRFSCSVNFFIASGRPYTEPTGYYPFEGQLLPYYQARNQGRLPYQHRMDLSFTLHPRALHPDAKPKKIRGTWHLTLYNLYARKNILTILYEHDRAVPLTTLEDNGLLIPFLTYSLTF